MRFVSRTNVPGLIRCGLPFPFFPPRSDPRSFVSSLAASWSVVAFESPAILSLFVRSFVQVAAAAHRLDDDHPSHPLAETRLPSSAAPSAYWLRSPPRVMTSSFDSESKLEGTTGGSSKSTPFAAMQQAFTRTHATTPLSSGGAPGGLRLSPAVGADFELPLKLSYGGEVSLLLLREPTYDALVDEIAQTIGQTHAHTTDRPTSERANRQEDGQQGDRPVARQHWSQ